MRPEYSSFVALTSEKNHNQITTLEARGLAIVQQREFLKVWRRVPQIRKFVHVIQQGGLVEATYPDGPQKKATNVRVVGIGEDKVRSFLEKHAAKQQALENEAIFIGNNASPGKGRPLKIIIGIHTSWKGNQEENLLHFLQTYRPFFDRFRLVLQDGIDVACERRFGAISQKTIAYPSADDLLILGHGMKIPNNRIQEILYAVNPKNIRRILPDIDPTHREKERFTTASEEAQEQFPSSLTALEYVVARIQDPQSHKPLENSVLLYNNMRQVQSDLLDENTRLVQIPWSKLPVPDPFRNLSEFVESMRRQKGERRATITHRQFMQILYDHYKQDPLNGVSLLSLAKSYGVSREKMNQRYRLLKAEYPVDTPPTSNDKRLFTAKALAVFALYYHNTHAEIAQKLHLPNGEVDDICSYLITHKIVPSIADINDVIGNEINWRGTNAPDMTYAQMADQLGYRSAQRVSAQFLSKGIRRHSMRRSPEQIETFIETLIPLVKLGWTFSMIEEFLHVKPFDMNTNTLQFYVTKARKRVGPVERYRFPKSWAWVEPGDYAA